MPELDLIPIGYRQEVRVRLGLRIFCLLYALLLACIGGTRYMLYANTAEMKQEVSTFEINRKEVSRKQRILAELKSEKADLDKRVQLIDKLQGGPSARQMFLIMDRSLDKNTWFKRWTYQRAEKFSEMDRVDVPRGSRGSAADRGPGGREPKLHARMEITGQAVSHSTLAVLVHNLAGQEEIEDVKVVRTAQGMSGLTEVLDFSLAIRLRDSPGEH